MLTAPNTPDMSLREKLSWKLAYAMRPLYLRLRPGRKRWKTTTEDLGQMPAGTLGKSVADFLDAHGITLMPDVEWHDIYHVIFGYGTSIREEGCIQFVPMGNGRWSAPHIACNLFFLLVYPEYCRDFLKAFRRGRKANRFYNWDFEPLMALPIAEVRRMIFGGATAS